MIVTCPGCSSKYRVRNESVPADGARMRCPKCETLFLAKPPADGATTIDDPSSMYQSLAPTGGRANTGPFQQPPGAAGTGAQPPSPVPIPTAGAPHRGPVTALFAAADPSQLPPGALPRPPTPAPAFPTPTTSAPSPFALGANDAMRVKTVSPSAAAPGDATSATGAVRRALPPTRAAIAGSWVTLGLGIAVFLCGSLTWAWTTEALPLDGVLMPVARGVFSAERPADAPLDVDTVRRMAIEAGERKDLPAAIVAWRRVKARSDESDRRPSEALAKMLVELGEVP